MEREPTNINFTEFKSNSSEVDEDGDLVLAFADVLIELQTSDSRVHIERYERLMQIFTHRSGEIVALDDLECVYNDYDPRKQESALRNLISRLNTKLESRGLRIEHVSAYRVVPIPKHTQEDDYAIE